MISSFTRYFIGLVVLSCVVSCNRGEAYYKFFSIPENQWDKDQKICFLLDTSSININNSYSLSLEVLHNISYQYRNLFLFIEHTLQDSILLRDTVECLLVDEFGRWQGSGNGATRQLSVLYKTNFKIDTTMHNEICIRHAMQDSKLKGIEKIGLKVY